MNCINYPEFKALAAVDKQNNLLNLCGVVGQILGGSANVAFMACGLFVDYFAPGSITLANLTKLAKAAVIPWWQAPVAQGGGGLSSPVSHSDLDAAGLS